MGLRQRFRFSAQSETSVELFLRELTHSAALDRDEDGERWLFTNLPNERQFEFECVIVFGGINTAGSGQYFEFMKLFTEGLIGEFGQFGQVSVEDA